MENCAHCNLNTAGQHEIDCPYRSHTSAYNNENKIGFPGDSTINSEIVYDTLHFNCGDNKELILTYGDGKLNLSGDGDMNKAAKDFFEHFLKPIADDYVSPITNALEEIAGFTEVFDCKTCIAQEIAEKALKDKEKTE